MSIDDGRTVKDTVAFSLVNLLAVGSASVLNLSIAMKFGAGEEVDAFFLAYAVPGALVGILIATMRVVLVPSFVRLTEEQPATTARRIIATIGLVGLILWLVTAAAGILGGPLFIKTFAPSVTLATRQLTIQMNRWMFATVPLTWLSEFLQALLNSRRRFILPPVGECLANILAIGLVLGLGRHTGVVVVGPGFVTKTLIQVVVSALGLKLTLKNVWPGLTLSHKHEIWSVLRGLAIRLSGALLRQSSPTVERFWSANLVAGTVSALSYAQMGANILSRIFSASVATVLLPTLSQEMLKQPHSRRKATTDALRLTLFLTAPVTAFSIIFSHPICQAIFASSGTHSTLVNLTSSLLAIYALRIPTIALISVLLAPFYALEDVWTPVKHMTLMLVVNLALDALLFPMLAVYGFPVAAVLTDMLSVARALWLQRRTGISSPVRSLRRDLIAILMSVGIAVLISLAAYSSGVRAIKTGQVGQLVMSGVAAVLGGVVYLAAAHAARIPEARLVTIAISQRILFWRPRC